MFTFNTGEVETNQDFVEHLIGNYGVVTIPMFGFYPNDAKRRNPKVGLNQLRLSFSFNVRAMRCFGLSPASSSCMRRRTR